MSMQDTIRCKVCANTVPVNDWPQHICSAVNQLKPALATSLTGREQILGAVAKAVLSDRNKSYGNPEDNFANIAYLWNWYLENRKGSSPDAPFKITPIDVAHMHGLMKYARLSTNPYHRDSVVDVAGYAACAGDMVKSHEEKQTAGTTTKQE